MLSKQDVNVDIYRYRIKNEDTNINEKWYRTFGKMLVLVFMSAHSAAALAAWWRRQRRWRRRRRKHRRRRNNADVRDPEALVGVAVQVVAVTRGCDPLVGVDGERVHRLVHWIRR
jgi:hypothetical protein